MDESAQKRLLRALFNVRPPRAADPAFLRIQDDYLRVEIEKKGITDYRSLSPVEDGLYLWRGDITTLKCDAIVNAANSRLLGCFCPNHGCVDNAIHTFAGVQLRAACAELMRRQGQEEAPGRAKLTPAFNLPSRYILHTVGPCPRGVPSANDKRLLAVCYRACLSLAEEYGLSSVAFCCISTGEFGFPRDEAAEIAVRTVRDCLARTNGSIEVIFNVFQPEDHDLYRRLLGRSDEVV